MKKAIAEMDEVCNVLEQEGVVVKRPDILDWSKSYETPDFKCKSKFSLNDVEHNRLVLVLFQRFYFMWFILISTKSYKQQNKYEKGCVAMKKRDIICVEL